MKILLINDHVHFGGGGDAVLNLEKKYLEDLGHNVYVYSWGEKDEIVGNCVICEEPKKRILLKRVKFLGSRKMSNRFKKSLDLIKPDIIHIHLVSKYPLTIYPYLKGYKVIQTLHGPNLFCVTSWGCLRKNSGACSMGIGIKCYLNGCCSFFDSLCYKYISLRLEKYLRKNVTLYHCPSRNIYNTIFNLGYRNIVYLPLGIDSNFGEEYNRKFNSTQKTILFVGAMSEVKGVDYLYEAFKKVYTKYKDCKLVFVGGGVKCTSLLSKIENDKLENVVQVLGKVEHSKIIDLYKNSYVFVVPSIWQEQFGLVGPEALSMNIPVIGSNIGGIPEWLHHNEWGYLVAPRDVDALADRILFLLEHEELANEMGKNGRKFVLKEYSSSKYLKSLFNLLESVCYEKDFSKCY